MTKDEMREKIKAKTREAIENLAEQECEMSRKAIRDAGLSELYRMGEPDVFHSFAVPVSGRICNDVDTDITGEETLHD